MAKQREFDVVIWGATGFTGRLVAQHIASTYGIGESLRWGIGGRNAEKLREVRQWLGADEQQLPGIVADAGDVNAMHDMAARSKAIATTVGPYSRYGNELIAACARSATHYCDLAGEVPWVRRMIDAHHQTAINNGAVIVPCSGFDSAPSDLGTLYLQQRAKEIFGVPAQRVHMLVRKAEGGISGGTATSMLEIAEEAQRNARCRKLLLNPYALNPAGSDGEDRNESLWFGRDEMTGEWVAPFLMAAINTRVVRRSAALLGSDYGEGFRYAEFVVTGTGAGAALKAAAISAAMASLFAGAALPPSRALLRRLLPDPGQGPNESARAKGHFVLDFVGLTEHGDTLTTRVTGDRDPGYGATSRMLGETVVALSELPIGKAGTGGFSTPAAALGDRLVQRFQSNAGIEFSTRAHSPAG